MFVGTRRAWIGYTDKAIEGQWMDVNGHAMSYSKSLKSFAALENSKFFGIWNLQLYLQ